jgi:uncharacterized protein (UPF0332 family)/predicted nucleotidyltransferase
MAKKKAVKKVSKSSSKAVAPQGTPGQPVMPKLSPEMEKKLKALKTKLDKFKAKVLDKFGDYIVGITVLPPQKDPKVDPKDPKAKENAKKEEDKIHTLVVVDDTDSKKMSKDELHNKFSTIIGKMAQDIDKNLEAKSVLLTDIWQNCYDGKYDINQLISIGAPIHDTGMLAAIKIAHIHKTMVMKKFEKYVLSYVLAGSLTQGRATPESDIDVWIVIDDTDVKKMTRIELKDKLRSIIISMGMEAGEITGIKNKINIQVYILTDFWDSLKEANPIIFTLLRDGVPFYDRGIFMPWKQLLRMGRIKPSREAIDLFMSTGTQSIKRAKHKLREMGMEDCYYAILTPSQAAIMLYGLPPPTPRETPEVLESVFVKKEKILEQEYVDILKANVDLRKKLEHGSQKELSGKELDKYITNAEKFLKRIQKLFTQIEQRHNEKSVVLIYDEIMTMIRDALRLEGVEKAKESEMVKLFENELITTGKIGARHLREVKDIVEAKGKFDKKELDKTAIEQVRKTSGPLIRALIEFIQRKRGKELERAKIRVKHGKKFGEVILLDTHAFVIEDIDAKPQVIQKAKLDDEGSLGPLDKCTLEEFEKALVSAKFPKKVFIKDSIFEDLKNIFGRHVEVLVHY